ncbi:hypothetical protein K458DRAFT_394106 [Lentithecium fluviatile CBS 122367]|uniref:Uncharacterized protein n=1 Tax=Lentithecium fluviatile CBS 122367 TaxID=1168545 RepID=A0A6G1ILT0_9PLEO|nr:hypothetical protein K458DRAFT_394106 [Lentithecium fluviatile CBS 122367]
MAETADSAVATGATPIRQQPSPQGCTGSVGPESSRQNNFRTSKKHRVMDIRAPARLQLGGGANTQDRAGAATSAATNARREVITTALAEAINNCMMGFKSHKDVEIANDLRSLVIQAIATSVTNTGSNTSRPSSGSDSSGAYSSAAIHSRKAYAAAAATPLEESDYSTSGSTSQRGHARAPPARTTHTRQDDDIRILLTVPTAIRLLDPALMAI